MKTKLVAIGAALTVLTLSLSGCGSSSTATGNGTVASKLIFGGPPEFKKRVDGIPGLKKHYGVQFGQYKVTDTGGPVTVTALKRGQVDAADLFTTDPSIKANGFVVLADPKSNFAAQNIVPIINKTKATPGVKQILNGLQAKLSTAVLSDLLGKVQNDKQDPDVVAKAWLSRTGLAASGNSAKGVTLTVGSANFPENVLLADIYAEALRGQGATIKTKLNIGSREKYYPALKGGSLDLFPEYTGTILQFIDNSSPATSSADVYAALTKALPANLVALDKAAAEDRDAVVVTKQTATKYGLTSIADLAKKG
ncbi:MAG: glycine betaine ABC transporter substrate-binding protein [Marmoricola sp.]